VNELNIELYTDKKDPEIEIQIEAVLAAHEVAYEKTETWIESEKMYEVLYQTEI
jgi:predicted nucleotide-binding protein (sugar kinase/HSP70/actin superfamily)